MIKIVYVFVVFGLFQVHVAESSNIADHCRTYALSDSTDSDFQGHCSHPHNESCAQCCQLQEVLSTLESECSSAICNEEQKSDMLHAVKQARNNIMSWKAHQLRSVHQDQAKCSVLAKMKSKCDVLLVQDWAMKFMPRKFREPQSDWFAKRGLPWHITVAIRKSEEGEQFESQTFVHVFQNCLQDSAVVVSIMQDCLASLKKEMPELERAYYKQDNAGCYHSGYTIVSAKFAGDVAGVGVERNDFSDPQGGKGICDRQAATIKGDIGRYVNEGNDVTTAIQLKAAIESGPGSYAKASYVTFNPSSTPHVKWDGVSLLNNFKYEENGIRAWRAFDVGPGKLLPWSQFEGVLQVPETLEVVDPPSQKLSTKPSFKKVRHRHVNKKSASDPDAASDANSQEQEDDDGENEQASPLFPCPEEGCVKAYSRFLSLQAHLDTGKHKRLPEQETLYDKAKRGYASKLMDEGSRISTVQLQCEEQSSQCLTPLPMGWALKTITKKTRFTQKQNEFLKQQFENGEQSGRKADPNEVSKLMRSSRDELGARRFLPGEVLTGQQITGFFSRLAAKKRLPPSTVNREESDDEATKENDRASQEQVIQSEICAQVMREVSLQHPIVSSSGYNICELMRMGKKKMMSLSVDMLRSICDELGVDVSDITQRRKNPFISRLSKLVGECGCTS